MVRSFLRNGRKHYGTNSSRQRHDHARCPSSNTAIASFAHAAEQGTGHQPEDGGEVAQTHDGRGFEDRAGGASVHCADGGRGGDGRRVPAPHAAATGRLSLRPSALDPTPDAVSAASVPAASRHLPSAGHPRRQAEAPEVQALPHRVLPYRHRRGADGRRQALPLCGH